MYDSELESLVKLFSFYKYSYFFLASPTRCSKDLFSLADLAAAMHFKSLINYDVAVASQVHASPDREESCNFVHQQIAQFINKHRSQCADARASDCENSSLMSPTFVFARKKTKNKRQSFIITWLLLFCGSNVVRLFLNDSLSLTHSLGRRRMRNLLFLTSN